MDFNKAIIVGRVSQAPELRSTPGGQSVASMFVATNRTWVEKSGQRQEEVQFHAVVLWGKVAETAAQFLQKGSTVLVEGRLETRSWQDKQGVSRKTTEIIAEKVQFGTRPTAAPAARTPEARPAAAPTKREEAVMNLDDEDADRVMESLFGDEKVEGEEVPF